MLGWLRRRAGAVGNGRWVLELHLTSTLRRPGALLLQPWPVWEHV